MLKMPQLVPNNPPPSPADLQAQAEAEYQRRRAHYESAQRDNARKLEEHERQRRQLAQQLATMTAEVEGLATDLRELRERCAEPGYAAPKVAAMLDRMQRIYAIGPSVDMGSGWLVVGDFADCRRYLTNRRAMTWPPNHTQDLHYLAGERWCPLALAFLQRKVHEYDLAAYFD